MENYETGQPQTYKWYEVWREVFTHPSEQTFLRILADPTASPQRAFIWVAVLAVFGGLIQGLLLPSLGTELSTRISTGVGLICGAIVVPIFAIIGLALWAVIQHFLSTLFGGTGTYNRMVYALGSISAPTSLVGVVVSAFTALIGLVTKGVGNMVSFCLAPISLAVGIYAIVLQVQAIKAVEKLDTGRALLVILVPLILVIILGVVCVFLALIPIISNSSGLFK
jgi:hypothetical protein